MATERERILSIFRDRLLPTKAAKNAEAPKPYIVVFLAWWLPVMGTLATGVWTIKTYVDAQVKDERKALEEKEKAQEERIKAYEARILEARKPYLAKRLDLFFEASRVGGALATYSENIEAPEWKAAELRFWALRWSELEMVGNPVLRERLRDLQKSIVALKKEPTNKDKKHNVRWKAECVADELRYTLDADWSKPINYGLDESKDFKAPNKTISFSWYPTTEERRKDSPSGCLGFREAVDDTSEASSSSASSQLPQPVHAPSGADRN